TPVLVHSSTITTSRGEVATIVRSWSSSQGSEPLSTTTRRTGTPWCWNRSIVRAHRTGWFQWTTTTVTGSGTQRRLLALAGAHGADGDQAKAVRRRRRP